MHPYEILDVFTDAPLEGNQVAIFADADTVDPERCSGSRARLNLSETVFVLSDSAEVDARVRIFTPTTELPFAGHPVLGTAFSLVGVSVLTSSGCGPDPASCRCRCGVTVASSCSVRWSSRSRRWPRSNRPSNCCARSASRAQSFPSRCTTTARGTCMSRCPSFEAVSAVRPDLARCASSARSASAASRPAAPR